MEKVAPRRSVQVAAIQMTSSQEVNRNLETTAKLIQDAATTGAKLIVLPEMFLLMGTTESEKFRIAESPGKGKVQDFLANLAAKHGIWLIAGTMPILKPHQPKLLASCLIYNDTGTQIAHYNKLHLFDVVVPSSEESYQESSNISPGNSIVIVDTPFGRLSVAVCYDLRFPELFRIMFKHGVEIIAVPAAFTVPTGKAHWEILLRARAIENFSYLIGACQGGSHSAHRKTYGHSMIVNPWGEIMACLPEGEGFITAEIDREKLLKIREDMPVLSHSRIDFITELAVTIIDAKS